MTPGGYLAYAGGVILAFVVGAGIGWSLCQQRERARAARELVRLWGLVPEAGMLRRAASYATAAWTNDAITEAGGGDAIRADLRSLANLAGRIETAQGGEGK